MSHLKKIMIVLMIVLAVLTEAAQHGTLPGGAFHFYRREWRGLRRISNHDADVHLLSEAVALAVLHLPPTGVNSVFCRSLHCHTDIYCLTSGDLFSQWLGVGGSQLLSINERQAEILRPARSAAVTEPPHFLESSPWFEYCVVRYGYVRDE